MSKKKRVNNNPVEKPKVEAPEQAEPKFAMKLEVMGAEPITLNGVNSSMMDHARNWFAGLGSATIEIPVGDNLLILDRSKVAYLVVGMDKPNEENKAE